MALTKVKAGNILLTTPSASSNDVTPATTAYVTTALANLADSAPETLNTLNELAAALGDDANFSTTVTNSIALKAPLASPTFTGTVEIPNLTISSAQGTDGQVLTSTGGGIAWEAIPAGTTINNNADNRIITGSGTANTLEGESNFTFDGTTVEINNTGNADSTLLKLKNTPSTAGNYKTGLEFWSNGFSANNQTFNAGRIYSEFDSGNYDATRLTLGSASGNGSFNDEVNITNGKVGIGTSSPDYLLDIENTSGNAIARLHSGTNGSSSLRLQNDAQHWDVNLQTNDKFAVYDHTAGTQPFTIMPTTGNVGIGTSSPDSRLHVYNNSANNYSTSIRLGQSYNTAYSQISSNFGGSMTINAGQGGGTPIMYLQVNGAEKARLSGTTTGRLYVSGTSRGRIVTQNETTGDGDDNCGAILASDYSSWSSIFSESWLGGSNGWGTFWAGSSGALYRRVESDTNPNEYVLIGSGSKRFTFDLDVGGNAFFDGTLTQNSYDYAEYFEWEDGNPDNEERRGFTVVLTDAGLIRKATSDDDPEEIMGAISGTAAVLGDAAMYDWDGKYEIDEWGTRILDDVVTISWTEEDENGESINHSYKETEVPSGVIVPEDAGRKEHKEYRLTADYDPEQEYVPRDKRPEWGIVGLLGKVRIRDESPKNPRWKYIKTIAGKKLWLIR